MKPLPKNWEYPRPVRIAHNWIPWKYKYETGGVVWTGFDRATSDDIAALITSDGYRPVMGVDPDSLVGRGDPKYTTFYDKHKRKRR